ncbi:MAG: hypothetical protein KAG28_02495 [Cocleimonas sp.]|nr:hypothetical protein [Cocleimonas sp.]
MKRTPLLITCLLSLFLIACSSSQIKKELNEVGTTTAITVGTSISLGLLFNGVDSLKRRGILLTEETTDTVPIDNEPEEDISHIKLRDSLYVGLVWGITKYLWNKF